MAAFSTNLTDGRNLNLALLGHGKTGKAVAQLAPQRGFNVRLIITSESNVNCSGITRENFKGIDVCVDFTSPAAVVDNISHVAALGCNLVVGTTGWTERRDEARKIVEKNGIGLVYAANFSIGVQLFYSAAQAAAEIFAGFPMYEPFITEVHHRTKRDAPSGTAKELKRRVEPLLNGREIPVSSVRAGFAPGTHELAFDSESDTIILRHTVRSRQGFAEGALLAARWVVGRKGIFTFADVLGSGAGNIQL